MCVIWFDDAFAKGLGMPGIKELKIAISDQISNEHNNITRSKMKKDLLDVLDNKYDFELPQAL